MLNLLATVLGCSRNELSFIEDCKYDLGEIGRELIAERVDISLPNICDTIFIYGQRELSDAFYEMKQKKNDRFVYLNAWSKDENFSDVSAKELKELQETMMELKDLSPSDDMTWTVNDGIICYLDNKSIYEKYLGDELNRIETNMGFEFEEL